MTPTRAREPIFISYRRDDAPGSVNALVARLEKEFGEGFVFMDVRGWKAGDFREALDEQVVACRIMLVVIGPRWLALKDNAGEVRLFSPDDFVRNEIAFALRLKKIVIPVLVEGAKMPGEGSLPGDIKGLAFQNGVELSHSSWETDVSQFVRRLRGILKGRVVRGLWYALGLVLSVVLIGAFVWYRDSPPRENNGRDEVLSTPMPSPVNSVQPEVSPTPLAPAVDLSNTTWKGGTVYVPVNDHADYEFIFKDQYNVDWVVTPRQGEKKTLPAKRCSYNFSGDKITITCGQNNLNRGGGGEYQNTLTGEIRGDTMTGKGHNIALEWTWKISKVR
ncbi:MAG TPA: toll/interleukin-1 receptor domain-containing protein [Pyrinomonadaceae bacterium]|jgi:hypothetical protein|nr:toll/interleukin-1 receptor domain-containing protein [Pyrinomonadaceae bacterium]